MKAKKISNYFDLYFWYYMLILMTFFLVIINFLSTGIPVLYLFIFDLVYAGILTFSIYKIYNYKTVYYNIDKNQIICISRNKKEIILSNFSISDIKHTNYTVFGKSYTIERNDFKITFLGNKNFNKIFLNKI